MCTNVAHSTIVVGYVSFCSIKNIKQTTRIINANHFRVKADGRDLLSKIVKFFQKKIIRFVSIFRINGKNKIK
jgi:hypothetical protein